MSKDDIIGTSKHNIEKHQKYLHISIDSSSRVNQCKTSLFSAHIKYLFVHKTNSQCKINESENSVHQLNKLLKDQFKTLDIFMARTSAIDTNGSQEIPRYRESEQILGSLLASTPPA